MTRGRVLVVIVLTLCAVTRGEAQITTLERQRVLAHLEMTSGWLIDEVSGLSDAQLAFKPAPDAWSIAEVLDHLLVVAPIYWNDLQQALMTPPGNPVARDTDADILWYGMDRTHRERPSPARSPGGESGISRRRSLTTAHTTIACGDTSHRRRTICGAIRLRDRGVTLTSGSCSSQPTSSVTSCRFGRSKLRPDFRSKAPGGGPGFAGMAGFARRRRAAPIRYRAKGAPSAR